MSLAGLLALLAGDPALRAIAGGIDERELEITAPVGARPFAIAALSESHDATLLVVTSTGREAEDLAEALRCLLPPDTVADFPSWETLPHERLSPRADTVGRRLGVLRRLAHPTADGLVPLRVVVTPVRAVLQPVVAGLGDLEPVMVKAGDEVDLDDLVHRLVEMAYTRVELVTRRGELAVRGGILDVFPPTEEHPVRLEFFGDEVEEIRSFAVADQRSLATLDRGLHAPPCSELLLTADVRERAGAVMSEHPELAPMLAKIADGTPVEGMEALAPVLAERLVLLLEELPKGTRLIVSDPERVRLRSHDLVRTSQEFLEASWANAAAGNKVTPIDLGAASYRTYADIREAAADAGLAWWTLTPFVADEEVEDHARVLAIRAAESYRGDTARAFGDIRQWLREGWRVVLTTIGHGPAERLVQRLSEAELPGRLLSELTDAPAAGVVSVTTAPIETGFVSALLKLAVLAETDLVGQRAMTKDMRRMPSRRKHQIDPLQLQPGDAVVHEQHGVGRYLQMVTRKVNGGEREYLVIEYAPSKRGHPGDRLYVPTDQLDQITRYVGADNPSLDKMGGGDWSKRKAQARKAVKEIAGELIRLYAARTSAPGYAFGPDTPWQRELEDAFPYQETPDQLEAIDEVKRDMESPVPMDRVICGDVGYGKTEIAVRAAFKAVQDGKQVAVLVPTTLLVQQHFATFTERFAAFPIKVAAVSRFNSPAEQRAAMEGVADGSVDVVIGTHRLLSKDTTFKDLGLVIVDEEQRFGVEHKEYLKQMRVAVDVLTLSATPIPRTLEMSITGIREMSVIATPPEERHPVLTFVGAQDDKQVSAAIHRELLREGQVFYIHNRVETIEKTAARIRELVPDARVETAHGQMHEDALERVMVGFWEREFDVLVCTTIVESGLDVPNANTLIVERADIFGLSQLHQLRGRVGRGRDRAYSYFLYSPDKPLTELALDRLATIASATELGAGMAVAMKDLEIRGAGNLLGGEQSGHINGVGFDLYVRMVGDAVTDYKRQAAGLAVEEEPSIDVKIELPVDAHLPHDYIPGERLRLEAYRRIAEAYDEAALTAAEEELLDRYGPPPTEVSSLLAVARLRILAAAHGVREITTQGQHIKFAPLDLKESQELRLGRLYKGSVIKAATKTALVPVPKAGTALTAAPLRDDEILGWCRNLLEVVLGPVSPPDSPELTSANALPASS